MKKRILSTLLVCALVCGAAACDGGSGADTTVTTAAEDAAPAASNATAGEITEAVLAEVPINSAFEKNKDAVADNFDGLDTDSITDFSYYICASGAYPDEIAVFRFDSSDSAENARPAVEDRLDYQKKTYKDYTPDEYYKLEGAVIAQKDEWLYYIVTSDNEKAGSIVKSFIG